MSTTPSVLQWIRKLGIRTVINAPAGEGRDIPALWSAGVAEILNVDIRAVDRPGWVAADLEEWRPDPANGPWDAAYINCLFCLSNKPTGGALLRHNPGNDQAKIARNIASWPVRHVIVYDTAYGFDWRPFFEEAGWAVLATADDHEGSPTRVELWGRADD